MSKPPRHGGPGRRFALLRFRQLWLIQLHLINPEVFMNDFPLEIIIRISSLLFRQLLSFLLRGSFNLDRNYIDHKSGYLHRVAGHWMISYDVVWISEPAVD